MYSKKTQGSTPATLEDQQLSTAVRTAVEMWLHQQGIDPENPPEDWRE